MSTSDLELLTIGDVAQLLQLKPEAVMQHTNGKTLPIIPSVRINRRVRRYRKADIAAFLEACSVNPIKAEVK